MNASQQGPSAIIQCSGVPVGLMFKNCTNLSLQKIAIVNCGQSVPSSMLLWSSDVLDEITVYAALFIANVRKLTTTDIHVVASNGYGLLGWNVMDGSVILNSKFYCSSKINASRYCFRQSHGESPRERSPFGGNALFAFTDTNGFDDQLEGDLLITSSRFSHGGRYQNYFNAFWLPGNLPGDTPVSGGGLTILVTPVSNITIKISNCTFDNNIADIGGNGFIHIPDSTCYSCHTHVIISNCNFIGGTALEGAGLYINYTDSSSVHIAIHHSNFSDNSVGTNGGGIAFHSTSTIDKYGSLHFEISTCSFLRNTAGRGAGFYGVLSKRIQNPDYDDIIQVRIIDTKFSQNVAHDGGGIFLLMKSNVMYGTDAMQSFFLTNCSFRECRAYTGAAVRIDNCYQSQFQSRADCFIPSGLEAMIVVKNVAFSNSEARYGSLCSGALYLRNVHDISLKDVQFVNNNCSSVYAVDSQIACKGKLEFLGNKASSGGAFDLNCIADTSLIYLYPESKLHISNNSAGYGGAIAAKEDCGDTQLCFFQPTLSESWPKEKLPQVILKNNTASIKGNSIYVKGGDTCQVLQDSVYGELHPSSFWSIFTIHGMNEIAATSYKACFCSNSRAGSLPEWMKEDECPTVYNITVYRGKSFNTTVVGVGQYNYPITSVLRTSLESESGSARLGIRQHAQQLSYSCTNVTYSITSIEDEVKLILSVENPILSLGSALSSSTSTTILKVTLLPCPFGFELLRMPSTCGCAAPLRHIPGISCDIDTTLIHHPPSMWIGRYSRANIIVVHRNCPFDYCKPGRTYVNVSNPDEQCASGHAGILCGDCKPGLSLALGTSQCLQCSNIYLLLLIPFTLAGVVLVFLLLKCNLTVSVGTINGLIFYVNIVRVNQTIFFPHETTNIFANILSVFISWLNLDLGIETCFFSGMDSYTKSWLQFLFPLYIWVMVAIMILTSRYSTNIARLIGSNAVQVLATLFLLSYAKLLRTVIAIASFTTLSVENGHVRNVWLLDGNVAYMSGPHVALFVAGMLATIFYILPFTALVALGPFLQARSGYKLLRWIKKLKPFLDAYHGPYKDKFRYWTGLMLVVRLVLFAIFAGNALGDPQINLFAIIMIVFLIMIYCWNQGNVYKNCILNILESFYMLNLGTFATARMFLKASQRSSQLNQEILACVMVGSVFVLSCTILLYHLLELIKNKGIPHWVLKHFRKTKVEEVEVQSNSSGKGSPEPPPYQPPTVTTVDLSQLRESLLSNNF